MVKENPSYLLYPINLKILRADPCQGILRLVIPFQSKCFFHLIEWFYFPFIDQFFPLKISYMMMVLLLAIRAFVQNFPGLKPGWMCVHPGCVVSEGCGVVCVYLYVYFFHHHLTSCGDLQLTLSVWFWLPLQPQMEKCFVVFFLLLKNQALSLLSLNTASQLVCKYKLWFQT